MALPTRAILVLRSRSTSALDRRTGRSRLSIWVLVAVVAVGVTELPTTWSPSAAVATHSSPGTIGRAVSPNADVPYSATRSVLNKPIVGVAATPDQKGLWLVASDGGVFTSGNAAFYGSHGGSRLNQPIAGVASTHDGGGYWLVAADGGIFTYGDAPFYGSTGAIHLNEPIVGMAPTPDGRGYWLVASDGGIFTFGDARFYGSTGAIRLNKPIVGMAPTPDGRGYWLVASDGGIFTFGDAQFYGSTGAIHLNKPIVGMASTSGGKGYWLVASDGGIFTFGDAAFMGSEGAAAIPASIVGIQGSSDGYSLIGQNGTIYPFGNGHSRTLSPLQAAVSQGAAAWLTSDVDEMVANQSPSNPIGLWIGGDPVYWRSNSGPGLAAAAVAGLNGDPAMLNIAVQTFNSLILQHQQPNGSFTAVPGTSDPQSPDIDTMFFVTNLGMALWSLRPQLSAAEVSAWTSAITAGANFLIANGNLSWYTNGNIAIGNALAMALAYWATGSEYYNYAYKVALAFTMAPPQARWPGFGFIYTKAPTQADGSDGAGYFAESGGGAPGFDADYTELQLDQLVRLYLITDSAAVLRLVNLEFNQEWPLVNTNTWMLDASGGTRHSQPDLYVPFSTPALALLALYGGRTDLVNYVQSQLQSIQMSYATFVSNWSSGGLYGFGVEAASLVLMGSP